MAIAAVIWQNWAVAPRVDPADDAGDAPIHRTIGARLSAARHSVGMSQAGAARVLGVSQSRVAKLELGQRRLTYLEAIRFAQLYQVAIDGFAPLDPPEPHSGPSDGPPAPIG